MFGYEDELKDKIEALQSQLAEANRKLEAVKAKLEVTKEALGSIASSNKPRHDNPRYWLGISHEQCSTVLAADTRIAREALKEIGEMKG